MNKFDLKPAVAMSREATLAPSLRARASTERGNLLNRSLVILSVLLITFPASAATWFVDLSNISGTEDGTTWATAFTTPQPAIDAAFGDGGGDVWVAQGTYNETRVSPFHAPVVDTGSLIMRPGVNLFGGFLGNETLVTQRNFLANVTTIDGSTSRGGLPAYHVIFGSATSLIDGFFVTGGTASTSFLDSNDAKVGGGFYANTGPITLRNVTFNENSAPSSVGGAVFSSQDLLVEACTFTNNTASGGGGVFANGLCTLLNSTFIGNNAGGFTFSGTVATLSGCIFKDNRASTGGGASITATNASISKCYFTENQSTAGGSGGGALRIGSTITNGNYEVANSVFYKNTSVVRGGALTIVGTDVFIPTTIASIQTSTFYGNVSEANAGAINGDLSNITVTNCIVSGNTGGAIGIPNFLDVTFSIVEGGHVGAGNLDVYPSFVDPDNGDFRLFSNSPAIDAGTLAGAPADDINGDARPQGGGVDMGALESNPAMPLLGVASPIALALAALLLLAAAAFAQRRAPK